jgi:hypothetical protein
MALLVLIAAALLAQGSPEIRNLRVSTAVVAQSNAHAPSVVLRSFEKRGRPFRLIVDSQTLATSIVPVAQVRSEPRSWAAVRREIADTAYGRALADAERNESRLQDAGLTHVLPRRPGVDLTVDLCPSRRPLDRQLFTALVDELGREERPVPVAIALTGVWMDEHPNDLAWLLSLTRAGTLAVTWINHSFHHRASASLPLRSNFLLEPGTDIASEVLKTEEAMLSAGITPSVFFRFPGLVSRPELFGKIVSFGLIPVGSDAWLAKNEWPREGSIVLVHANGNEPLGVHRFLELLRSERQAIREKSWQLFDLRESVVATEDPR